MSRPGYSFPLGEAKGTTAKKGANQADHLPDNLPDILPVIRFLDSPEGFDTWDYNLRSNLKSIGCSSMINKTIPHPPTTAPNYEGWKFVSVHPYAAYLILLDELREELPGWASLMVYNLSEDAPTTIDEYDVMKLCSEAIWQGKRIELM